MFSQVADPYIRQARLAPALCVVFPIPLLIFVWFPALQSVLGTLVSLACSFGVVLWVSQLGRDAGKRREPELYENWNGKPSVALLRHSDHRIDSNTKARYKSFLTAHVPGLVFPSAAEEIADKNRADKVYEFATAWLLAQTRDTKKFSLLFQENISYGFRRNLWGLKPLGIALAVSGGACSSFAVLLNYALSGLRPASEIVIATAAVWCLSLCWVFAVRPSWVKVPADGYGLQLLAACDRL